MASADPKQLDACKKRLHCQLARLSRRKYLIEQRNSRSPNLVDKLRLINIDIARSLEQMRRVKSQLFRSKRQKRGTLNSNENNIRLPENLLQHEASNDNSRAMEGLEGYTTNDVLHQGHLGSSTTAIPMPPTSPLQTNPNVLHQGHPGPSSTANPMPPTSPLNTNLIDTDSSQEFVPATQNTVPDIVRAEAQVGQRGQTRSRRQITKRWTFGPRTAVCPNCQALMWLEERVQHSRKYNPKFNLCCQSGDVVLPLLPSTPAYLEELFTNPTFRENIRLLNSLFGFTSMGGRIDHSVVNSVGPYSFRISGENYHLIGSLLPPTGEMAKFIQLYIYDTDNELQNRMNIFSGRNGNLVGAYASIVEGLKNLLDAINPYVQIFRSARDVLRDNSIVDLQLRIISGRGDRQYIRPTANEVAALIVGGESGQVTHRDIVLVARDGHLKRISEIHPSYMPLQYLILFPYGTDGWHCGIRFSASCVRRREFISMREFYAFRIQHRDGEGRTLLKGGKLLQQFAVDCYAAIEYNRLNFIKTHQSNLRAELYQGLEDAVVAGDTDAAAVGRRFVLPSSFSGGPRNMVQHFQDAIAICRVISYPDLFITFTCNSNWPEIKQELTRIHSQKVEDRPDITARVFRIRQKKIMDVLKKNKLLGSVLADVSVIEFQKRGLPHTHITLTLASEDKPRTPEEIDTIITAEIPDKNSDPLAYETVIRCMLHGPCGAAYPNAPCMVDGKCSKHYPKSFRDETTIDEDGFVSYRRRNDPSKRVTINGFTFDNRWVVSYNRDLVVMFDAHINVEKVARPEITKYLYKYMSKGVDRANVLIEDNVALPNANDGGYRRYRSVDEVKQYLDCRYLSAIESCWKIFEFEMQRQYPSVIRLQYHLPDHQFVIFNDDDHLFDILEREHVHRTMLTEWFEINKNTNSGRNLTFVEFPSEWTWKREKRQWEPR